MHVWFGLRQRGLPVARGRANHGASMSDSDRAVPRPVFSFDTAVAVAHLRASDPALARIIDAVGPFRMELNPTHSLFTSLSEAIVYQQLTGRAAATIYGRLCGLFPRSPEGPTPKQISKVSDDKLRLVGLSRAKAAALRDLAQKTLAGELPDLANVHGMHDDAIVERLTTVRGIGPWTVHMLLMFRLGRPDVMPVNDYGIRKGFALAFKKRDLPPPKDITKRAEKWRPYRTVASWYLWRAVDLHKNKKAAQGRDKAKIS